MMKIKIGIVGAGLSGLACGAVLSEHAEVILFEKEERAGGLAATFYRDGKNIPMAYHHVQTPEYKTIEYCKKAGIHLDFVKTTQGLYYNGVSAKLTSPLDILRYPHLSLFGRIGLSLFGARCMVPPLPKQGLTAFDWLNRWAGKEAREHMFEPMAKIKFGSSTKQISALWLARRMREKVRANEGHAPIDVQTLINYFKYKIRNNGGQIRGGTPVHHLSRNTINGEKFDKVISSIPPKEFLKCKEGEFMGPDYEKLERVKYQPCVCSVVSLDKSITPHYWNIVLSPELPFGGFFDYSLIDAGSDPAGGHLYYFVRYPNINHTMLMNDDYNFKKSVRKTILGVDSEAHINWIETFTFKNSTPIYDAKYPEHFKQSVDGIYLTGHYMLFPLERTMHTAILSGEKTAERVIKDAGL